MGFLSSLFGGDATKKAGKKNAAALEGLNTRGQGYINTGADASRGFLSQIGELFTPYAEAGSAATTMRGNALGLNGPEGNAAAVGAFQQGPGYQFAVDQAMQGAARAASAGGALNSGNTQIALQDRASGLANQEYGSWLDRLMQTGQQGLQAAGGQASGVTNQAELEQQILAQKLGLDASVTQGMNNNRNNTAAAQEQGLANMLDFGTKFLGFLGG